MRTTTTATTIEENKGDNDPFDSYVKGRLESACWRGDLELVKTLLSEPSSSSALSEDFRDYLLYVACRRAVERDDLTILSHLFDTFQINVNEGQGPLMVQMAAHRNNVAVVRYLIQERGALVNQRLSSKGRTALHWAVLHDDDSSVELLQLLLQHQADTEAQDWHGATPLSFACRKGNVTSVQLLLKAGTLVSAKDEGGFTGMHWACLYGHVDVVRLLLQQSKGLLEEPSCNGWTPLHLATQSGKVEVLRVLLDEYKVNIMAKTWDTGESALHLADNSQIAKFLVESCLTLSVCQQLLRFVCHKHWTPLQKIQHLLTTELDVVEYYRLAELQDHLASYDSLPLMVNEAWNRQDLTEFQQHTLGQELYDLLAQTSIRQVSVVILSYLTPSNA